jgi:ATP-binding cassette subfamily B protein
MIKNLLPLLILWLLSCKAPVPQDNFPDFRAKAVYECGPVCLKIIAKYYGRSYPLPRLAQLSEMDTLNGTNMLGIANAADSIGFKTMAVSITYQQLRDEAPLPAMLHWEGNYFVVVYKIKAENIYIAHPQQGRIVVKKEDFLARWQTGSTTPGEGIALLFEPKKAANAP